MRARLSGSSLQLLRQPLRLLLHEVAVHEEQPLQRHVGLEALLGARSSAPGSRTAAGTIELVAADLAVDGPPRRRGVSSSDGPPIFSSSAPDDEQDRVAHLLGGHPPAVGAPVAAIAGILRDVRRRVVGARLIHGAQHDLPVQLLDRVAVVDERLREVLEQLGIASAARRACRSCSACRRGRCRSATSRRG